MDDESFAPTRPLEPDWTPALSPTRALTGGFDAGAAAVAAMPAAGAVGHPMRQGFRAGGLALMVRYEDGSELADLPPLVALPRAPRWCLGMANLHGSLVPVFDPADFFGLGAAAPAKPMLLVLGHGLDAAGVLIDGLPRRLRLAPQDRLDEAAVPDVLQDCVDTVWRIDGQDWMDLRQAALLERLEAQLAA